MDYYINNNDEKCCDSKHKGGVKMIGYGGDERSPNHPKKCPNERERERGRNISEAKGVRKKQKVKKKKKKKSAKHENDDVVVRNVESWAMSREQW